MEKEILTIRLRGTMKDFIAKKPQESSLFSTPVEIIHSLIRDDQDLVGRGDLVAVLLGPRHENARRREEAEIGVRSTRESFAKASSRLRRSSKRRDQ